MDPITTPLIPNKKARAAGCVPFGKVVIRGVDINYNFYFVCEVEQTTFVLKAQMQGYEIVDDFFGYTMNTRADYALTSLDLMSSKMHKEPL